MWLTLFFIVLVFLVPGLWVWYLYVGMPVTFDLAVHEMQEWDHEFEAVTGKKMKYLLDPTLELREHQVYLRQQEGIYYEAMTLAGSRSPNVRLPSELMTAMKRADELKKKESRMVQKIHRSGFARSCLIMVTSKGCQRYV
jgi:hypothetical protein